MNRQCDVVVIMRNCLAGMHPDPDSQMDTEGPLGCRNTSLGVRGKANGVAGVTESQEEAVAFCTDLETVMPAQRRTHDSTVLLENRGVVIPQLGEQPR
jgi:hypothetical protein